MKELIGAVAIVAVVAILGPSSLKLRQKYLLTDEEWQSKPPVPYVVYSKEAAAWLYLSLTSEQLIEFSVDAQSRVVARPCKLGDPALEAQYIQRLSNLRPALLKYPG